MQQFESSPACSGWRLKHEPKPGQHRVSTTTLIQDHFNGIIREIGEDPLPLPAGIDLSSQDAQNLYKMKAIYNDCMDVYTIKNLAIGPLKKVLGSATIALVIGEIDPDHITAGLAGPMDFGMPSPSDFNSEELHICSTYGDVYALA
ncbi:Endothelin-converting enzyme-like 1 [Ceratocystis lukuohia]|uniref:Endothelin-converting enzyme-like 1 n=1 Tax=Ceratocystis lukuohia TaxID=2019550 RepID=A0ABR4MA79_9PEZI